MKTYELFEGDELKIAEKIQQRRLQILVHSCIYYELNQNIISDKQWDDFARELVSLQNQYPQIADKVIYANEFRGFDASTGFDLPLKDEWVMAKAKSIITNKKSIARKYFTEKEPRKQPLFQQKKKPSQKKSLF